MRKLICLMYHGIETENPNAKYSVTEAQFKSQLEFIKLHDVKSVALSDFGSDINGRLIHISFDDGALSDYTIALTILKSSGFKATFFITTGYVGKAGYMSWDNLRELSQKGFDIQSHTHTHVFLATLDKKKIEEEMHISRDILQQKLAKKIVAVSLPGGSINQRVIDVAYKCGYQYIFTSAPQINNLKGSNIYGRVLVTQKTKIEEFREIILANRICYLRLKLFYNLRNMIKAVIGQNSYHFLWRTLYNK